MLRSHENTNLTDNLEYQQLREIIDLLSLRLRDFYILPSGEVVRNYYAVIGYRYNHRVSSEHIQAECEKLQKLTDPDNLAQYQSENLSSAQKAELEALVTKAHRLQANILHTNRVLTVDRLRLGYDHSIVKALNYCPEILEESININQLVNDEIYELCAAKSAAAINRYLLFFIKLGVQFLVESAPDSDQVVSPQVITTSDLQRLDDAVQKVIRAAESHDFVLIRQIVEQMSPLFGLDTVLYQEFLEQRPEADAVALLLQQKPVQYIAGQQFPPNHFV